MISLRFVGGGDIVSRMVSRGEYGFSCTHVEFVQNDGSFVGAHCPRGVAVSLPGYDAAWAVWSKVATIAATDGQVAALDEFLSAQLGKPYDIEAIAAIAAGMILGARDWQRQDAWTCSELVAAGLEQAGVIAPIADMVSHLTPRDVMIFVSSRLDAVWAA